MMNVITSINLVVAAGVAGFLLYAASFALVQIGRMDGNGLVYTVCNMGAASLVLVSMFDQFNLGSLLTQVTWIGVGLVGVFRRLMQHQSERVDIPQPPQPPVAAKYVNAQA